MSIVQDKKKVILADSQFLVIEALLSVFGKDDRFQVVGVNCNRSELQILLSENKKALLLVDYELTDFTGISDFKNFLVEFPDTQVIILTNSISKPELMELMKCGFKNILLKTCDREEMNSAIDASIKGKKHYSHELLDLMVDLNIGKQSLDENKALTSSELEIVKLISNGLTTKEIAQKKNISFHTVNTHRKNIFRKMGVTNVSELVMNAIKLGWIDTVEYYI